MGSSEICCAWASAGFGPGPSAQPAPEVPASSWRLTSPRLSPAESKGSSGLPAACSADREGVGLAGLLLRETPGSCVMAGSHRLMANLGPEREGRSTPVLSTRASQPRHPQWPRIEGGATGTCPSLFHASRSSPLRPHFFPDTRLRAPPDDGTAPGEAQGQQRRALQGGSARHLQGDRTVCPPPAALPARAPARPGRGFTPPRGGTKALPTGDPPTQPPAWPLTPRCPASPRPRPSRPHPNLHPGICSRVWACPQPDTPRPGQAGLRPG